MARLKRKAAEGRRTRRAKAKVAQAEAKAARTEAKAARVARRRTQHAEAKSRRLEQKHARRTEAKAARAKRARPDTRKNPAQKRKGPLWWLGLCTGVATRFARHLHRRISLWWRDASLKTSFMVYMLVFLLVALAGSSTTSVIFGNLQDQATQGLYDLAGIYLYDPESKMFYQADSVRVPAQGSAASATTPDLSWNRTVFVQSVRNEYARVDPANLPSSVVVEDVSRYLYIAGGDTGATPSHEEPSATVSTAFVEANGAETGGASVVLPESAPNGGPSSADAGASAEKDKDGLQRTTGAGEAGDDLRETPGAREDTRTEATDGARGETSEEGGRQTRTFIITAYDTDLDAANLTPATIHSYDAAARERMQRESELFGGAEVVEGTSGGGLIVSPVGYYLWQRPLPGAERISGLYGLLAGLAFPLWFGLCIWGAARRFFNRRVKPALGTLEGAACKIRNHDLDFAVSYDRADEMGVCIASFEEMRASLAQSQRALWRTAEERKRLNAAFAHDLRTPLTVLHGKLELMQARAAAGTVDPGKLADDCATLAQQVERLERYVAAMGSIQRLEDRTATYAPVDLAALAREIGSVGETLATRHGKAFEIVACMDDAPAVAQLDREIIVEVAENLVGNAMRYASARVEARLSWIRGHDASGEGPALMLAVADDGPGFSPEALERGCAPFFSESKNASNFGLGLNIALLLCEQHGGTLRLANNADKGAVATARFAAYDPQYAPPPRHACPTSGRAILRIRIGSEADTAP